MRVELVATVKDKELWEKVDQQLDGLRIFGKKDVKDEMLEALGDELEQTDTEKEQLQTRVNELEAEVSRYRKIMGGLEVYLV